MRKMTRQRGQGATPDASDELRFLGGWMPLLPNDLKMEDQNLELGKPLAPMPEDLSNALCIGTANFLPSPLPSFLFGERWLFLVASPRKTDAKKLWGRKQAHFCPASQVWNSLQCMEMICRDENDS